MFYYLLCDFETDIKKNNIALSFKNHICFELREKTNNFVLYTHCDMFGSFYSLCLVTRKVSPLEYVADSHEYNHQTTRTKYSIL